MYCSRSTPHFPLPVRDPRLFLAAGRRDRQVLGHEYQWTAGDRRRLKPGRRCQRSLPTEVHHRVSRAGPTCPHSCACSPRAEMGSKLPSVDLGAGRTAVAITADGHHACALLVRLLLGRLGGMDRQYGEIELQPTRAFDCRTLLSKWTPREKNRGQDRHGFNIFKKIFFCVILWVEDAILG